MRKEQKRTKRVFVPNGKPCYQLMPGSEMPDGQQYRSEVHRAIRALIAEHEENPSSTRVVRVPFGGRRKGQLQTCAHTYASRQKVVIQTSTDKQYLWIKLEKFPPRDAAVDILQKGAQGEIRHARNGQLGAD